MMNQLSLTTLILILVIGFSCARNEDTLKDYTIAGEKTGIDKTAPTVSSTSPANLSITSFSKITVTFSESVDETTLSTDSFIVLDNSSSRISGTVTTNNQNVTFKPETIAAGNYTATIKNSVKDLAGNSIAQKYSWSFENSGIWELVTSSAPWGNRREHSVLAYNDKLWLMGGYTGDCNTWYNDVWYSTDGENWTKATSNAGWSGRGDLATVVFDNKMWVSLHALCVVSLNVFPS